MVATDGHRLAKVESKVDLGDVAGMKVIVPPKALSMVRSYSEGEEKIDVGLGENSISFDMEATSIYSRLLEGQFPNYEKVIPENNEKELVVSRTGLIEATKRVSILSDTLTHQVVFSLEKDKLALNVTTQELGEAHEELDGSFSGDPMEIGYNAVYVQDILRTMEGDEISFLLDRADNAGVVAPVAQSEEIKHLCIIMPLRIN
jgi:DNA polymerase-3 subunit beta